MEWHTFILGKSSKFQKLPKEKKYILVLIASVNSYLPSQVVLGYLKYPAGDKNEPQFITPGNIIHPRSVVAWCDCLPKKFDYPAEINKQVQKCLQKGASNGWT